MVILIVSDSKFFRIDRQIYYLLYRMFLFFIIRRFIRPCWYIQLQVILDKSPAPSFFFSYKDCRIFGEVLEGNQDTDTTGSRRGAVG